MKTNFINSTSYFDSLKAVVEKINAREVDLNVRHLLIVPERYTLLAEKYLYHSSQGSFDVEVLSPSRLFYKMNISTPLLSREGAIMLIRGMLPSIKLDCFNRSASYRGFCEKLYDAINDFAANGVRPDEIPSSSPKLSDLKAIYSKYLELIQGRFVDSMGKIALIAQFASTSSYLDNVHIYVANFDYIDKATRNALDAMKNRALSYTECVVEGKVNVKGKAFRFNGDGALAVKEAAKRLRYAAYNGVAYEDMAVIVGNADNARIKRIFSEFDIPCFIDQSKRLSDYAISVFLQKLFECALRKKRESFVELSKNLYVGVDKDSADTFENYVYSNLIDYKGFFVPFVDCDDACEKTRKRLVELVEVAQRKIKSVTDAQTFGELIEDVLAAVGAEKITQDAFDSDALITKTRMLIKLMEQVGIRGNFDFVYSVFAEGIKATKISQIPYDGGVIVGDPASLRGGKYKLVVVLGFDDGFLPQIYDDSSLIGDDEKALFDQMERVDQINFRYERELACALSMADEILLTCSKPSTMIDELMPHATEIFADDTSDIQLAAGSKKHAIELMTALVGRMENAISDNQNLVNALHEATKVSDELFVSKRVKAIDGAEKLFFAVGATSVSQLQEYFKCPFLHFASHGLRLRERSKGELSQLDVGNFMHLIIEKVVKKGNYSDIDSTVDEIVAQIISSNPKFALDANREMVSLLVSEAKQTIKIYAHHLCKSNFKPIGQEIEFVTDLGDVKLRGKIDMADEYEGYIRLIDYKTGESKIGAGDVYYGRKIQLPLYMAAASAKGYKKAAMMNFPFSYRWLDDKFSHRFSGFLVKDDEIMRAIDSVDQGDNSEVFNLKTSRNDSLLTSKEMDDMVNYAVKLSQNAVTEMKEGYVASSPSGKACDYCAYGCLCFDRTERKTIKVTKSVFGEKK